MKRTGALQLESANKRVCTRVVGSKGQGEPALAPDVQREVLIRVGPTVDEKRGGAQYWRDQVCLSIHTMQACTVVCRKWAQVMAPLLKILALSLKTETRKKILLLTAQDDNLGLWRWTLRVATFEAEEFFGRILSTAVTFASRKVVKLIVDIHNENPVYKRAMGNALVESAQLGHHELVAVLLKVKKLEQEYIYNAMWNACREGHLDVAKVLVEDRGIVPSKGVNKALKIAAASRQQAIVELLLSFPKVVKKGWIFATKDEKAFIDAVHMHLNEKELQRQGVLILKLSYQ